MADSAPSAPSSEPAAAMPSPQSPPNAVRKPSRCYSSLQSLRQVAGAPSYFSFDAEMVTVKGPEELPERRAMVSIGVVNERLETVLYARVAVPKGCQVIDGAFAREQGGLWASWDEGIPASCVSDLLERHAAAGGVVVGWEVHNDLDVFGFEKAASEVRNGSRESLPLEKGATDGSSLSANNPPTSSQCSSSSGSSSSLCPSTPAGVLDSAVSARCTSNERRAQPQKCPTEGRPDAAGAQESTGRGLSEEKIVESQEEDLPGDETGSQIAPVKADGPDDGGTADKGNCPAGGEGPGEREYSNARLAGHAVGKGMRVVEVTDLFRTMKGHKCTLTEAYTCCFDRVEKGAHNAATDARMAMELFNLWRRAGEPDQPLGVALSFFVVNFHSFKPSKTRHEILWTVLRPEGIVGVLEKDSGSNTYKLSFRTERGREAYLHSLERNMSSAGLQWGKAREFVPGKKGAGDGFQLSCARFKMHVFEQER
ncbi:unnamed protein product [Scytosiphon promiscuus]